MEKKLKVCPNCNTVNDLDSKFCRHCGKELEIVDGKLVENEINSTIQPEQSNPEQSTNDSQTSSVEQTAEVPQSIQDARDYREKINGGYNTNNYAEPKVNKENPQTQYALSSQARENGVTDKDYFDFVGENGQSYLKQFSNFEKKSTHISWNWIVFLFGLFLGPVVAGFWFLHRKMYKIAAVIMAIGIIFTAVQFVAFGCALDRVSGVVAEIISKSTYNDQYDYDIEDYFSDYYNDDEFSDSDEYNYDDYSDYEQNSASGLLNDGLDNLDEDLVWAMMGYTVLLLALGLIKILAAVLLAMYANYLYYKFATKKITEVKSAAQGDCTQIIKEAGGTSVVGWIVGTVVYSLLVIGVSTCIFINFAMSVMNLL